jgi:NADH-quinone oxidoreductase subunit A
MLGFFWPHFVKLFTKRPSPSRGDRAVLTGMGAEFTPLFLFVLVAILVAVGMIVTSAVLGPRKTTPIKQMPYESGMDPIGDARQRFDVRYYLVAIVFLLFDVELLYLYPWAVAQWSAQPVLLQIVDNSQSMGVTLPASAGQTLYSAGIPPAYRLLVFGEILVFIAVLAAAFAYAWRKGVFTWR